jgi:hypothetical protein
MGNDVDVKDKDKIASFLAMTDKCKGKGKGGDRE